MRDFNEVIGDDSKRMAQVIAAGILTNVHVNNHGHHTNIATYIRGKRRVDYCFVPPGLSMMSSDADLRRSMLEKYLITEDIL